MRSIKKKTLFEFKIHPLIHLIRRFKIPFFKLKLTSNISTNFGDFLMQFYKGQYSLENTRFRFKIESVVHMIQRSKIRFFLKL